jgi:hypothetical protein
MERVRSILRVLLRRALSEHGREAPALTDITIERASGRFEPRLGAHFSSGYRTWAAVRPDDCYAVCERYAAWDLTTLRRALLCEAHEIYARMCAEHLAELGRARERRSMAATIFDRLRRRTAPRDRDPTGQPHAVPEPAGSETDEIPRRQETQRRLLEWWAQQRNDYARSALFGAGMSTDIGSKRAQERGIQLLKENLTPIQRKQYEKYGYFDVTGGKTGKRYRIRHGRQMNIEQLDRNGRRVCGWCFFPQGSLVSGDVMLAQKAALELYEADALRLANRF